MQSKASMKRTGCTRHDGNNANNTEQLFMSAADVAAENFYENMQAANADYENVCTNRSPVKGEPYCLHVVTDGMERLGYDHFGSWSP